MMRSIFSELGGHQGECYSLPRHKSLQWLACELLIQW